MGTYIILESYTEPGIQSIKDSPKRIAAAKQVAKKVGGKLKQIFVTMGGSHDVVVIAEFPDDAAAATFVLRAASGGNIRTSTLKAFTEAEFGKIVAGV